MLDQFRYVEPPTRFFHQRNLRRWTVWVVSAIFFAICWHESKIDFHRIAIGLPKAANWLKEMFPPNFENLTEILHTAFETLAMATTGTFLALVFGVPLAFLGARNTSPHPVVYHATRWIFNISRGTETLVFALIFTAAVGFGPLTGVLAIAFHMMGAIGKMLAEVIEPADQGPIDAVSLTGAQRVKVLWHALIPDVMPNFIAVSLYMWEFSVRTSTVLGIVGAGGIGQTLKNTIDLLDFPQMFTVLAVILIMVTFIDMLSDALRRMILKDRTTLSLAIPIREVAPPGVPTR